MTAGDFRKLALSFPEAIESAHMHHPDFRVRGKIFATLGYPDKHWAVVKLTPNEQKRFIQSDPKVFNPGEGRLGPAWKRKRLFASGQDRYRAESCRRGLAEHRTGATVRD